MRSRLSRRWLSTALLPALLLAVLAGCDGSPPPVAQDPGTGPTEGEVRRGEVCPERLYAPRQAPEVDEPATAAPDLPRPDRAWVCQYALGTERPRTGWTRAGEAREVDPARLDAVAEALGTLEPAQRDRICTMDIGPRWMLVVGSGNDLTGVVVDDFGCQEVRLAADPVTDVPGAEVEGGTVAGVLRAGGDLLSLVKTAYRA